MDIGMTKGGKTERLPSLWDGDQVSIKEMDQRPHLRQNGRVL